MNWAGIDGLIFVLLVFGAVVMSMRFEVEMAEQFDQRAEYAVLFARRNRLLQFGMVLSIALSFAGHGRPESSTCNDVCFILTIVAWWFCNRRYLQRLNQQ